MIAGTRPCGLAPLPLVSQGAEITFPFLSFSHLRRSSDLYSTSALASSTTHYTSPASPLPAGRDHEQRSACSHQLPSALAEAPDTHGPSALSVALWPSHWQHHPRNEAT